jgi:hypothetical protein
MRLKAVFIGFGNWGVKNLVRALQASSSIEIDTVRRDDGCRDLKRVLTASDAVFINRSIEARRLDKLLGRIRRYSEGVPVVIAYEGEPDGRAFLLARRYDCWLFNPDDNLGITLTPAEVGQGLEDRVSGGRAERALMDVSLCAGPCSTGD